MRILALETSTTSGSLALLQDAQTLARATLPSQPRVAQTLVPAIQQLLRDVHWTTGDLQRVAVTRGPGSFTGLRVGVTTAKTLAYALKIPVLGVDTLEVVAWQAFSGLPHLAGGSVRPVEDSPPPEFPGSDAVLHAVLDAQRGDLFQATFRLTHDGQLVRLTETRIVGGAIWLRQLQPGTWVAGSGLRPLLEHLPEGARLPEGVRVVAARLWTPQAAVVGLLAQRDFEQGKPDELWTLTPAYYRPSAAEEKAALAPVQSESSTALKDIGTTTKDIGTTTKDTKSHE